VVFGTFEAPGDEAPGGHKKSRQGLAALRVFALFV